MAFIPKKKDAIYTDYIYHLFSGKDWSAGTNRAVMGTTLNKATLSSIDITIPTLNEQQAVASKLNKLDGLISLRKQQLAKLDELVKSRDVEQNATSRMEGQHE